MTTPDLISWADFDKIELRVGTVLTAVPFANARKPAYQLTIDFGPAGIKRSSAQLTVLYQPADLVGRQVVAVLNFPPRQIANFFSECLILGAVAPDGTVTLLGPERPTDDGLRIG
jgi:tRNA-binding protein